MKNYPYLLGLVILAGCANNNQNYNLRYDFGHPSFKSAYANTNAVALNEKLLAVGSTVTDATEQIRNLSITAINPQSGYPIADSSYEYRADNYSTISGDLVQSLSNPELVVMTGSHPPFSEPNIAFAVFETDPTTGSVNWAQQFGDPNSSVTAKSMARNEKQGIYYVLAEYEYRINVHTENEESFNQMYVCALDKAGTPRWESYYEHPEEKVKLTSAEMIYDPEVNQLIITSYANLEGKAMGAVVSAVNADDGEVISTIRIPEIGQTSNFKITDMIYADGRYILTGFLRGEEPTRSFMLYLTQGLKPNIPVSAIYSIENENLWFSGVRRNAKGKLFIGFTHQAGESNPNPGLIDIAEKGDVVSSFIYEVPDYDASVGLLTTVDQNGLIIKGYTGYESTPIGEETTKLSLVSVYGGLKTDEKVCSREIKISVSKGANAEPYELQMVKKETAKKIEMVVISAKARILNCRED